MSKTDSIVESIINQFRKRSELGIKKYGTTLAENNSDDFLEHLKQELMDAILYIQKLQSLVSQTSQISQTDQDVKMSYVFLGEAKYNRNAYLSLVGNQVIFDCSDSEYGPITFPIETLRKKLIEHEK